MNDFEKLKKAVISWAQNPSVSEFLDLQNKIFEHPLYQPYSDDHHIVTDLFVEEEYEEL